jgi:alpha-2-macroglobulin
VNELKVSDAMLNRVIAFCVLLGCLSMASAKAPQDQTAGYQELRTRAEQLYAQKSFAMARELYQRADAMELPATDARWVDFRLADTLWRSQAATQTNDSTNYERAQQQLTKLIADIQRVEDRDIVWAEANESLGDFGWNGPHSHNWGSGWSYYSNALDWWAGTADIEAARIRYLAMVWKMAEPAWAQPGYEYHYHGNVPLNILDNALKIAVSEADRAHAHFLIALNLRHNGDVRLQMRISDEFEAALAPGKSTPWYDDALYTYGLWLMQQGPIRFLEGGQWTREADFIKALAMFERLTDEFNKGQTRYWDEAKVYIAQIKNPLVTVSVSNVFLPSSEIQYQLSWRNVDPIELELYRVDLTRDIATVDGNGNINSWVQSMDLSRVEKIRAWTKQTNDKGDHKPGQSAERLEEPPGPGAYVIQAKAGAMTARDLILITDSSIIVKTVGGQLLAYVCDALTSAPVPNATVRTWRMVHKDGRWQSSDATKQADDQGLCVFDDRDFKLARDRNMQYFIAAKKDDRQAFAQTPSNWYSPDEQQWRIYAFTDRPAYRPAETVNWKIIARTPNNTGFTTPDGQTIFYDIFDPRGSRTSQGTSTLNAFGSAWGSLELTEAMPLGEYRVTFFKDAQRNQTIGSAMLFRLEEYKLPEFKVAISTPQENGRRKSYILGEYVETTIQADYYFGGPVANANVEVVVYQAPFYYWWQPQRDYPWIYQDENPYRWWGGGEQIIKRESLRTDSTGKAVLTFDTPLNGQQDLQYRIEARVTDASRREITANDSVRVTRQRYYVHSQAKHNIHKPGDKIEIEFKAKDANDQPVKTQGNVKVTRDQWVEIWTDPTGKEVSGIELRELQDARIFPPMPQHPLMRPWQLKYRGYKSEDILTTIVKLDDKGEATLAFTAGSEGYYRIHWQSEDTQAPTAGIPSPPIVSETFVWVATNKTTQLGYRHDGLQIIVDQDTFRSGQTAPVMINTPTNDRYVLFSVEGDDLYSYQLVHVTGNVKLVQVQINDRHVPNVFLSAMMSHNGELHHDQERINVPPVEQYLKVEIASDRPQYQPGEEGKFTIKTTDHDGKPVSAEVALAVTDESVTYIQQDYAGDPRAFFFQRHQQLFVTSNSSFQHRPYVKLVKWNENQLIDEKQREVRERQLGQLSKDEAGQWGGKRGGGGGSIFTGGGDDDRARAPASLRAAEGNSVTASVMDRAEEKLGFPMQTAAKGMRADDALNQAPPLGEPAVVVRSDFRSTLVWEPSIITNESGIANVSLKYADSLTSWNAKVRVNSKTNQFGIGETVTRTKMPLIARLQAPRFFLVGDTVTISGVINNNTDQPQTVTPELHVKGLTLMAMLQNGQPVKGIGKVEIPANGEARVDWQVAVESPGQASLKLIAKGDKYADAMEKSYTIYEHGVERFIAKSGKVRGNDVTVKLDIPSERKVESTALMVQVSPSMAVTMLDALPYLIDYPYGCTEQTMSRFLPAAITAKTLNDLGIKPEVAMAKVFGGIEQQFADKTHPKGKQDLKKLDEITQASLNRLYDFQHGDGGWGWWKEGDSDHYMSAYVLWGLCLAKDAGLDIKQDAIDRAAAFLDSEIVEEEANYDQQAWILHALASYHATMRKNKTSETQRAALENIWNNREKLNAYTRSLLALSAHNFGDDEKAKVLVDNLLNGVKRDMQPDTSVIVKGTPTRNDAVIGTAHWGEDSGGGWWRWSDGGIEATAFALRAILAINPKHELVEPVTNWLIKNRRGAQWSNTRDTAIVVLAMNDYLRASGELAPEIEYELFVNGTSIVSKKLSAEDVLSAPSRYAIDRKHIRDGANEIRIVRKNGAGAIYFAAEATFFSLEDPVPAAGNEIFVRRDYFKLVPRPTLLKGYVYDRVPLADGGNVKSGERVEVVMTIEAKNNYEYLIFEDLKPAGLEAVAVRSGESLNARQMKQAGIDRTFGDGQDAIEKVMAEQAHAGSEEYTGRNQWVYQELRDRKVAMFIDRLPEGVWEIRYDLRAETPGRFHALPVLGHAMYVPEIRANSAEVRISVIE